MTLARDMVHANVCIVLCLPCLPPPVYFSLYKWTMWCGQRFSYIFYVKTLYKLILWCLHNDENLMTDFSECFSICKQCITIVTNWYWVDANRTEILFKWCLKMTIISSNWANTNLKLLGLCLSIKVYSYFKYVIIISININYIFLFN